MCKSKFVTKTGQGILGSADFLSTFFSSTHFLGDRMKRTLTETVRNWREYFPEFVVLPHPSPRNNIWLKKNGWFEAELVPKLKETIKQTLE